MDAVLTDSNKRSLEKNHGYNTRNKFKPNHPKVKLNSYQRSFLCKSILDFESFPLVTQKLPTLSLFMADCKRQLLHDH